jgi:hypothetical protein
MGAFLPRRRRSGCLFPRNMDTPARLLLLAALLGGCAADRTLKGAAAARSRGAGIEEAPAGAGAIPSVPALPGSEGAGAEVAPRPRPRAADPWMDDALWLARVNGHVITLRQVRHRIGPAYEQSLDRKEALAELRDKTLREIVLRRLVADESTRIGVVPDAEDMERYEERQRLEAKRRGSTLEQMFRDFGMTRREWEEKAREEIFWQMGTGYLTGRYPPYAYREDRYRPAVDPWVGPGEVVAWGERHAAELGAPASLHLRILDFRARAFGGPAVAGGDALARARAAAEAAAGRLAAGEPIEEVVKPGADGTPAPGGGIVGPVLPDGSITGGTLRKEYLPWAFAPERRVGDVSEPLAVGEGWVVLRLEQRTGARLPDPEAWAPAVSARLEEFRAAAAWEGVLLRLLEDAAIAPEELRRRLVDASRESLRRIRADEN